MYLKRFVPSCSRLQPRVNVMNFIFADFFAIFADFRRFSPIFADFRREKTGVFVLKPML
jgi:hypothetical protein